MWDQGVPALPRELKLFRQFTKDAGAPDLPIGIEETGASQLNAGWFSFIPSMLDYWVQYEGVIDIQIYQLLNKWYPPVTDTEAHFGTFDLKETPSSQWAPK
jgi:hypothetical protein